jgi:hypothetical protein
LDSVADGPRARPSLSPHLAGDAWGDGATLQEAADDLVARVLQLARDPDIKIPPTNLQPGYDEQARAFASKLADGLEVPALHADDAPRSAASST